MAALLYLRGNKMTNSKNSEPKLTQMDKLKILTALLQEPTMAELNQVAKDRDIRDAIKAKKQ